MRIKITGINGYIGSLLAKELSHKGHKVSGVQRKLLYGDTKFLKEEISLADVVINLAGASILKRWTKSNMRRMYKSRISTTQKIVYAIKELPKNEQPKKVISASAIGIYQNNFLHNEKSLKLDNGFVGRLVKDWEAVYSSLPKDVDLTLFRIGLVIGKEALTIKKMKLPFQLGLGARIGSGQQAFPFIHEQDVINAFVWAVENNPGQKVYNLVAPTKITNSDFTLSFSQKINRPAFLSIPSVAIKLVLGKASVLLVKSPVVEPKALLNENFDFMYPDIDSALEEILK